MFKSTIIAIILFMMSLGVSAAPQVMTYADFVHLSNAQKDQYIIKLMELSVELESRYKKETAEHGYSKERFERYTKILRTLKSVFLIDSAYAVDGRGDTSWNQLAKNFNSLMSKQRLINGKPAENCIFAGWVSRVTYMKGADGKMHPTCTHPDFLTGVGPDRFKKGMSEESKGYPEPKPGTKCANNDKSFIQCNPVIFGYEKASLGTFMCVPAREQSENSSFGCMKAALEEGETTATKDSKADRLKDIRERLSAPGNEKVFQQVWEFTYKTCVCETTASPTFSAKYQEFIRPHRTCYGLMEMMGSTALECTQGGNLPLKDTKIFSDLKDEIKNKYNATNLTITETQSDKAYTDYLAKIKNERSDEYLRICEGKTPPEKKKEYQCKADCQPDATDTTKVTCKYSILLDGQPAQLAKDADGLQPKEGEKQVSVKFTPKDGKEETATCEIPQKEVPKDTPKPLTCSADCKTETKDGKDSISCSYKLSDGTDAEIKVSITGPTEVKAEDNDKDVDVKYKLDGKDKEESLKCKVKVTPKETPKEEPKKELACTADCATGKDKDGKDAVSCTYSAKEGDKDVSASVKPEKDPLTAEDITKTIAVKYKVEGSDEEKKGSCTPKKTAPPKVPDAPKAPMNFRSGLPQLPQVQIRGTSDTSAIGIK